MLSHWAVDWDTLNSSMMVGRALLRKVSAISARKAPASRTAIIRLRLPSLVVVGMIVASASGSVFSIPPCSSSYRFVRLMLVMIRLSRLTKVFWSWWLKPLVAMPVVVSRAWRIRPSSLSKH